MRLAWEQEVEDFWFAAYRTYRIEVRRAGPGCRRAEVVVYNGKLLVVRHECAGVEEARAWVEALVEQVEAREAASAAESVRPVLMPVLVTALLDGGPQTADRRPTNGGTAKGAKTAALNAER